MPRTWGHMRPKTLYLLLCAAGLLVPYSQFIPWMWENRSLSGFLPAMFANRISAFFALDVVISAAVLLVFMAVERKRLSVHARWAPIAALLAVGVSLAFPLFLYLRELGLEQIEAGSNAVGGR